MCPVVCRTVLGAGTAFELTYNALAAQGNGGE